MDYRLKLIYEQMIAGKQSLNNSTKSLTEAYTSIYEKKLPKPPLELSDIDVLSKITDIQGEALTVLHQIYESIKTHPEFLAKVILSHGTPKGKAYSPSSVLNYVGLSELITSEDFNGKRCVITFASSAKKLRTPSPLDLRIAVWASLTDSHVHQLSTDISQGKFNVARPALKPLVIFALYQNFKQHLDLKSKAAAGIGAELRQVEAFNDSMKGLSPVNLIIPGDTNPVPDVNFNLALKVPGVGKADIALFNTETKEEVFWISFKDSVYNPDPTSMPQFQQWGSPKTLYSDSKFKGIQSAINVFLTKTVAHPSINTVDIENIDESLLERINSSRELKKVFNNKTLKQIHVMPEKTQMYLDLFNKSNIRINSDLTSLALKAIYGTDFEIDKNVKFGRENVNLIIETPQPLKFIPQRNEQEDIEALIMTLENNAHIIKNPKLPEHQQYLPSLIVRYTSDEYFIFNDNTEVLLSGRVLIYPIGKVRGSGIEVHF